MNRTNIGFVAAGVVAGLAIGVAFERLNSSNTEEAAASGSRDATLASRDDLDARIADLTLELEALKRNSAHADGASTESPRTPEDTFAAIQQVIEGSRAGRKSRETNQLLAAGFSAARIEWLRNRTDELVAERKRAEDERKRSGLPSDFNTSLMYLQDADLDLRDEIGDAEYERYREALGRPAGVEVDGVVSGSAAASAGLKPGDQIIRYGGKRIFNLPEVRKLASKVRSGEPVSIEVLRAGQTLHFMVPGGRMGIETLGDTRDMPDIPGVPKPRDQG